MSLAESAAFRAGYDSIRGGHPIQACPESASGPDRLWWVRGWLHGLTDAEMPRGY